MEPEIEALQQENADLQDASDAGYDIVAPPPDDGDDDEEGED
jgi:hypothetical protein